MKFIQNFYSGYVGKRDVQTDLQIEQTDYIQVSGHCI